MTQTPDATPPDAVVRFRTRTLVWLTTVAAILAAIAGPYFRSQSSDGQIVLLTFWLYVAAFAAFSVWRQWRGMWRQPRGAGAVDFILWQAPKRYWGWPRTVFLTALSIVGCVLFVGYSTKDAMAQIQSARIDWFWLVLRCWLCGMVVGSGLLWLLPKPVRFCTAGVWIGDKAIPWTHIRSAEWAWSRPGVVRLHRLEDDVYAQAPMEVRRDVEAYLRQRTTFINPTTIETPQRTI
jgi:hypothetical protein